MMAHGAEFKCYSVSAAPVGESCSSSMERLILSTDALELCKCSENSP